MYLLLTSINTNTYISRITTLYATTPPRFDQSVQKSVSARRGGRVTLLCHARGDAPVTLLWQAPHTHTHDYSVVHKLPGEKGVRGELTLPSVTAADAGTFTCTATNSYGQDTFTVTLQVEDVPETPHGLRVVERDSRFINVSWLEPTKNNNPIHKYILQYKKLAETWSEASEVTIVGGTTSSRVEALKPDAQYLMRVKAVNHLGASLPSETLQVSTRGEAPSAAPSGVRANAISSSSISITWTPPPTHAHHGHLLGYHVGIRKYELHGRESYKFISSGIESNTGRQVVNGLDAWVQYQVVVRAYNTNGNGPVSATVLVRTHEDVPSLAPVGVECNGGLGGESLQVRWSPPPSHAHNGLLKAYRLLLTHLDDTTDKVNEVVRLVSGTEEVVGGLHPWTNYTISVAGVTGAGAGLASSELTCTTDEDVAGIPNGIRALQSGTDEAIITWLPPIPLTGILQGYTLHHRSPHTRSPVRTSLHAHATAHTLSHLSHGTHEFWLTARTRVGEGQPTPTTKLTIVEQVPASIASWGHRIVEVVGRDIRLPCTTLGSPPPRPTWTSSTADHNDKIRHQVETDGSLVIRSITRLDQGNYTCSLSPSIHPRQHINTYATYTLHVQAPPGPPAVHISGSTATTLTMAWSSGDTGGALIHSWAVWWRAAAGGDTWHNYQLPRNTHRHTINDLHCGQEYQVGLSQKVHINERIIIRCEKLSHARKLDGKVNPLCDFRFHVKYDNYIVTDVTLYCYVSQKISEGIQGLNYQQGEKILNIPSLVLFSIDKALNLTNVILCYVSTVTGPGSNHESQLLESNNGIAPLLPLHRDPRLLASAAASTLALSLTIAATVICVRRKISFTNGSSHTEQEAVENKKNLMHQRESHYATVRKPLPIPISSEKIPEFSEDIYPYATFKMGEIGRISSKDDTESTKFQTYVFKDSIYGITEARPLSSESETEHGTSSRTESSNQLDSATLESRARLPLDGRVARKSATDSRVACPQPQLATNGRRSSSQTVHHNLIYQTESSTSPEPSPITERKSFPRKTDVSKKFRLFSSGQRNSTNMPTNVKQTQINQNLQQKKNPRKSIDEKSSDESYYGFSRQIKPPTVFSSRSELSEAECDLALRGSQFHRSEAIRQCHHSDASRPLGHPTSQFKAYVSQDKANRERDFSIKYSVIKV
ncbi:unnamed protein product, partial [Meganyctiphanes norvegica]